MIHPIALWKTALQPMGQSARWLRYLSAHPGNPLADSTLLHPLFAVLGSLDGLMLDNATPSFAINRTEVEGCRLTVTQDVVLDLPYMRLLHFRKEKNLKQPRLLLVAPLAGHFATLLCNTVGYLLPHCDVFVTDWKDAKRVPVAEGEFHFEDYTDYLIQSLQRLEQLFPEERPHVVAVCQATVNALMATALLAESGSNATPVSLSLIAGPVDPRVNPTQTERVVVVKGIDWLRKHAIFRVPPGYPGSGQRVFPGFIPLSLFLTMNISRHLMKYRAVYRDLLRNKGGCPGVEHDIVEEYLSVLDISAPFFLESLQQVFIESYLPRGRMMHRGRPVELEAITNTGLFTVEAGCDEICPPGQTVAAHEICSGIPKGFRARHLESDVGHYGAWNGIGFRDHIAPALVAFMGRCESSLSAPRSRLQSQGKVVRVGGQKNLMSISVE